LLPTARLELY